MSTNLLNNPLYNASNDVLGIENIQ